jgi:hypothetical protein
MIRSGRSALVEHHPWLRRLSPNFPGRGLQQAIAQAKEDSGGAWRFARYRCRHLCGLIHGDRVFDPGDIIGLSPTTTGVVREWRLFTTARASTRASITWPSQAIFRRLCRVVLSLLTLRTP